ncbi:hypothetical protein CDAR_568341 [Caerostris darwini]|uniref:SOCS box domain-containing protein n=1 Tax=Caerostris darwini TaxID=1538125 RepID=A0AAV4PM75_9ARAC|nr:hypothetical protein CDAR_568341 [Caerostris darwini]
MDLTKPPGISERRHFLLILTFACFNNRRSFLHVDVGLKLLWKSLPDAFLTYREMEETFQMETSELQDMYDYYQEAVQEYIQVMKPRCLQDLCRWTIRKSLDDNNLCLPNAVEELKVPRRMKRFLNLSDLKQRKESDDDNQSVVVVHNANVNFKLYLCVFV